MEIKLPYSIGPGEAAVVTTTHLGAKSQTKQYTPSKHKMKLKFKDINVGDKLTKGDFTLLVIGKDIGAVLAGREWYTEFDLNSAGYQLLKKPKTKKVKKIVSKKSLWEPLPERGYYYITGDGLVNYGERSDPVDELTIEFGNCFQTHELALNAVKKVKRILRLSKHS